MDSTPASMDTQPAWPRRSSSAGLHRPMRVFLDANVIFSAAKSNGAVRELLARLYNGKLRSGFIERKSVCQIIELFAEPHLVSPPGFLGGA